MIYPVCRKMSRTFYPAIPRTISSIFFLKCCIIFFSGLLSLDDHLASKTIVAGLLDLKICLFEICGAILLLGKIAEPSPCDAQSANTW